MVPLARYRTMSEHYSTAQPTSEERSASYRYVLDGAELVITTVSGVFGKKGLDRGSQVLIEYADLKEASTLLDLGCGTGVVGIALARRFGVSVTFADVNERAVRVARANAAANGVTGSFLVSDGFSAITGSFDAIVLNPPQSAGRAVCESLITGAKDHLVRRGRLFVVARHNKGGRSLSAYMESVYGSFEVLARKSGYRLYVSVAV
ncbi:MAG: class I SAM-dependent methyltransferase [Candidatus Woesearchaeota archaeon]